MQVQVLSRPPSQLLPAFRVSSVISTPSYSPARASYAGLKLPNRFPAPQMQPQFRGSVFSIPQASPADRVLAHIPPADQAVLADFFKRFLLAGEEPFGFTLFGNKPLTLGMLYRFEYTPYNEKPQPDLMQGATTLLKYQPLFNNSNFVFKLVKPYYKTVRTDVYDLMLLNRKACLDVIGANLNRFQQHFGPNATPKSILQKIENTPKTTEILPNGELMGLLFGYGRVNNQTYARYMQLQDRQHPPQSVPIQTPTPANQLWITEGSQKVHHTANPAVWPYPGYANAQAELDQLVQEFPIWGRTENGDPSPIQLPIFRNLFRHPENQVLTQNYINQRNQIAQVYQSPDLLKRVIEQLLQPAPGALQTTANLATRQWVA